MKKIELQLTDRAEKIYNTFEKRFGKDRAPHYFKGWINSLIEKGEVLIREMERREKNG